MFLSVTTCFLISFRIFCEQLSQRRNMITINSGALHITCNMTDIPHINSFILSKSPELSNADSISRRFSILNVSSSKRHGDNIFGFYSLRSLDAKHSTDTCIGAFIKSDISRKSLTSTARRRSLSNSQSDALDAAYKTDLKNKPPRQSASIVSDNTSSHEFDDDIEPGESPVHVNFQAAYSRFSSDTSLHSQENEKPLKCARRSVVLLKNRFSEHFKSQDLFSRSSPKSYISRSATLPHPISSRSLRNKSQAENTTSSRLKISFAKTARKASPKFSSSRSASQKLFGSVQTVQKYPAGVQKGKELSIQYKNLHTYASLQYPTILNHPPRMLDCYGRPYSTDSIFNNLSEQDHAHSYERTATGPSFPSIVASRFDVQDYLQALLEYHNTPIVPPSLIYELTVSGRDLWVMAYTDSSLSRSMIMEFVLSLVRHGLSPAQVMTVYGVLADEAKKTNRGGIPTQNITSHKLRLRGSVRKMHIETGNSLSHIGVGEAARDDLTAVAGGGAARKSYHSSKRSFQMNEPKYAGNLANSTHAPFVAVLDGPKTQKRSGKWIG